MGNASQNLQIKVVKKCINILTIKLLVTKCNKKHLNYINNREYPGTSHSIAQQQYANTDLKRTVGSDIGNIKEEMIRRKKNN